MTTTAIRISITEEVAAALKIAKLRYPALSDPEILKLGLSKIVTDTPSRTETAIRRGAAYAVGDEYLADDTEDIYPASTGTKVSF